jgi:class 3 adenylate cyclase
MPLIPWSHLGLERDTPMMLRRYAGADAMGRTVVSYDNRGSGLSDRDAPDYSLAGHVLDLEAVVDHLGLEEVALIGWVHSGPVAMSYAARYPDRVSQLVLVATYARGADYVNQPQFQALYGMIDKDWELFAQSAARYAVGWEDEEMARPLVKVLKGGVAADTARKIYEEIAKVDVSDLLGKIRVPTLVIDQKRLKFVTDTVRNLAARIPDAEMAIADDWQMMTDLIADFLGGAAGAPQAAPAPRESGAFQTILFTDVEGSTALTERLGDAKARELLREHERITRDALQKHGGSEVKTMGDGFMASFSSATSGLECAIAIQRAFADWNADVGATGRSPLQVRVGMNAGEPIAEDDPGGRADLFGTAVNLAARICARAEAGQILAPIVVHELAAGKGFLFSDLGETELRGFEDPVRLYEVSWRSS